MTIGFFGKLYVLALSIYFIVSGTVALLDIDAKLSRIGLSALNSDGKIAFILIYCSLMVGIGISMGALYLLSRTWLYSAAIAVIVITSFIVFRLVGAAMSSLSSVQLTYVLVEVVEVSIGVFLIVRSGLMHR